MSSFDGQWTRPNERQTEVERRETCRAGWELHVQGRDIMSKHPEGTCAHGITILRGSQPGAVEEAWLGGSWTLRAPLFSAAQSREELSVQRAHAGVH